MKRTDPTNSCVIADAKTNLPKEGRILAGKIERFKIDGSATRASAAALVRELSSELEITQQRLAAFVEPLKREIDSWRDEA